MQKVITFFTFILFLISGCKTQIPAVIEPIINEKCKDLLYKKGMYDYFYIDKIYYNKYPVFDLYDTHKLYYFKEASQTFQTAYLWNCNTLMTQNDSIMPLFLIRPAYINSNNILLGNYFTDIVFANTNDYSIYSFDSIHGIQVTWLEDNYIAFIERQKMPNVPQGKSILKIIKEDGTLVDTFENIRPYWTGLIGNTNGEIVYSKLVNQENKQAIMYLNTHTRKNDTLFKTSDFKQHMRHIAWNIANLNEIYWTCINGIYKTNIQTKETTQIKEGCTTKHYEYLAVSPNGKQIAAQRWDMEQMPDTVTIKRECNIYLMDIDGENEYKLNLD